MPASDSQLAALSNADRLIERLQSLRRQRQQMADWRKQRAAEPPDVAAGRVADVLAVNGPTGRDAVRRKLNLTAAALTAAITHGVERGLFAAEHKPTADGTPAPLVLRPAYGKVRYRRADAAADEAYNGEFRRLAAEHFAKLPLAEQVKHQPAFDQFANYNHMRAITAEVLKRGGTPDEAHDLAVRMLYGGSTQHGSPLFADHDLSKSSYLTRFHGYRNGLAGKYAGGGLNADVTAGRATAFSGLDDPEAGTDFASGVSKAVRQTDVQPAFGRAAPKPKPLPAARQTFEYEKKKKAAADRPDSYYVGRVAAAVRAAGPLGVPHEDLFRFHTRYLPTHRIAAVKKKVLAAGHAVERVVPKPLGTPGNPDRRLFAPEHAPTAPDPKLARLRQVAELLKQRATPTQIKTALGLNSRNHAYYLMQQAKKAKLSRVEYNKVEYFADLAEPETVLRYARWKNRPYYVVFRTKGGKKKRRIVRFDGTHADLHAECERRGHTLLYSEPATDAHAQIVAAAGGQ